MAPAPYSDLDSPSWSFGALDREPNYENDSKRQPHSFGSDFTSSPPLRGISMASAAAGKDLRPSSWHLHPPSSKPDVFFTLPLEIRDMIYDIVYKVPRVVKVRRIRSLSESGEERRKIRDREDYEPGEAFPESSLARLLVNKQYFEESCKTWIRCITFEFDDKYLMDYFGDSKVAIHRFILPFVARIKLTETLYSISDVARFTGLRHLSLSVCVGAMEDYDTNKLPWLDDFTDFELARQPPIEALLQLRGLQTLELRWMDWFEVKKPQHHVKVAAFKAQVEALLHDVVTQPSESGNNRGKILTLDEALKTKTEKTFHWSPPTPETSDNVEPITSADLPITEGQMLRLCLSRPKALFKWMQDAARKMD